jgi:hypothetical protein
MGRKLDEPESEPLEAEEGDKAPPPDDEFEDEIAIPEDRYSIACVGCGIETHLQMIPHKNYCGILVGWVFCCEKCRPNIIGRRVEIQPAPVGAVIDA